MPHGPDALLTEQWHRASVVNACPIVDHGTILRHARRRANGLVAQRVGIRNFAKGRPYVHMKRRLLENIKRVEQRIADACGRVGRNRSSVTLVAITKYASLDIIRALVDIGVAHLGENRVQELTKRAGMVNEWLGRRARDLSAGAKPRPNWHMVGHLQRNKVRAVLPWIDLIHSVDSLRLAEEIDAQSAQIARRTPILLQINITAERQKSGVAVAAATHLAQEISSLEHIELRGLMSIGPLTDDDDEIRYAFSRTRELFDEIVSECNCGAQFRDLSLGMSNDFEIAIEFGATHVRIGSALYEGIELSRHTSPAESSA